MAKKQKVVMLGSSVTGDLSLKADKASPTFTGTATVETLVITKGITIAPAPMGALVVDVAELRNAVSIAVNSTLTFSATPATGATFGLTITETSGTAREVTFPESYSQNLGVPITVFTVPANGIIDVSWERTATGYKIFGDPLTVAQQKVVLGLQVVDIFGLQSELDAKAEETHAHSAADVTSGVLTVERGGTGLSALGTALQVLRVNAGATALEFGAASGSGDVATDAIFDAKGDLAVGTGANTAAKLSAGTNGYVLTADSAEATGLKWAAPSGGSSGGPLILDGGTAAADPAGATIFDGGDATTA